jgi:hypothetical protein
MLRSFIPCATLFLFVLTACNQDTSPLPASNWQLIAGRDEGQAAERPLLYRACVPSNWIRQDPSTSASIADTTKSICEFYIQEEGQNIRLTIHTFPIIQGHMRIPPQAQIARWKKQFEELDPLASHILPESHGGFSGLYFEGQGILQGSPTKVMGWSMQLASGYERQLSQGQQPLDRLKRADYTIKASGPPVLMDTHRAAIMAFARSFELIDELPSPL